MKIEKSCDEIKQREISFILLLTQYLHRSQVRDFHYLLSPDIKETVGSFAFLISPTVKHLDLCPSTAKGEINYFRVVFILWLLTKQTDKIKETTNIWKKKNNGKYAEISKVPENFKKRKMRYKSDEIICFGQFM